MKPITIRAAFGIAIAAENAAAALYRGLEAKFADHQDLATLWRHHEEDEKDHARWLAELCSRLGADHLARRVDNDTIPLLRAVQGISVEKALEGVGDLEDAWRLVNEIENGETNAVFQFLLNNFEMDLHLRGFLRNQIDQHVARLDAELPAQYRDCSARKRVLASS
jgi:hypothetical protein